MPTTTDRSSIGYVPADLDATRFDAIEPLIRGLLERPVASAADLERWLLDRSELSAACAEAKADLYIAMTCNTEDESAQAAYTRYIEEVEPRLIPLYFELDKRLVDLERGARLPEGRYGVLLRATRADVDLFRPENVPIQTELAKLSQKYDQVQGAMLVAFEGRDQTMPQMARYQEYTDRAVREASWRAVAERRLRDAEAISGIYDEMLTLRHRLACNAGFKDFVGYAFKSKHRFDYGVEECRRFHDGVEKAVVPFMRHLDRERQRMLGVEPLRPWDLGVDVRGRGPLKPFKDGPDLVRKSLVSFQRLHPLLASMFAQLGTGAERVTSRADAGAVCYDLDSRKGKAPGGYQYMRDLARKPFIFMNAAGMHKDMVTMVHEAGHAFHSMFCRDEPLVEYRSSPIEFAEVASMSMELLSMRHWGPAQLDDSTAQHGVSDPFYPRQEDFQRACREQLKRSTLLLPWIATIDAFQHWIYSNPGHSRADRELAWLALDDRFGNAVSWTGLETQRAHAWQRQLHLFGAPFYYIEYGIAQLGALQLWLHSLERGERSAIEAYIRGLSLGGSRTLPELFAAAGLTFDFGPEIIKRLVDRVARELDKYPE